MTFLLPSVEEDYLSEGILIKTNTMKQIVLKNILSFLLLDLNNCFGPRLLNLDFTPREVAVVLLSSFLCCRDNQTFQ